MVWAFPFLFCPNFKWFFFSFEKKICDWDNFTTYNDLFLEASSKLGGSNKVNRIYDGISNIQMRLAIEIVEKSLEKNNVQTNTLT